MKSYIKSIGTALPPYRTPQMQIAEFMAEASDMNESEKDRLNLLYRASGIKYRHSVIPDFSLKNGSFEFFPNTKGLEPFPSVGERMKLYEKEAIKLSLKAIENCIDENKNLSASDITHLITVSCTGMYAPGLDLEIVEKLDLRKDIQRTCVNFMGCYAAFNGLKLADSICRSDSNAHVLVVCVELCTIHFQKTKNWDQILSNAIFSDGAAAVMINSKEPVNEMALSLESFYCDIAPEGKSDMAWNIADFGFEMVLSSYIPNLVQGGIKKLTENLLRKIGMTDANTIDFFAIHPGGKKIVEVIEEELSIEKRKNKHAYEVLREFGNMSSATVLFVLRSIMKELNASDEGKNVLSFAFGPGLTLESMLLKIHSSTMPEKIQAEHPELAVTY